MRSGAPVQWLMSQCPATTRHLRQLAEHTIQYEDIEEQERRQEQKVEQGVPLIGLP